MDEQQQEIKPTPEQVARAAALRKAIAEAMFELVAEHKEEIVRRARAKLVGMGLILSDEEAEAQL